MKTLHQLLAGWMMLCLFQPLIAQNLMVIHQGNGTKIQLPLESIDSIRFMSLPPPVVQKIFQNNGNILSLAVGDIDSITYSLPNPQSLPQVSTQQVVALSSSSVYAQGAVLSDGGSAVTQRGFCWSLQPNPSLGNNFTTNGSGNGGFGASIAPLQAGTMYYVRAYATNASGTAYGAQISVSTQAPSGGGSLPTISTTPVQYSPQQGLSAICGGNVTADGGLAVTARGVCWAAGTTPTLNHQFTMDGAGAGAFTSNLSNLLPNTTYFVRAYATNDAGTVYGVSYAFTTIGLPVLSTDSVLEITSFSAKVSARVLSNGGGNLISRGFCWSTSPNPTTALPTQTSISGGIGPFIGSISGLDTSTTYYVRAFAINDAGTAYGNQLVFTTTYLITCQLTSVVDSSINSIVNEKYEYDGSGRIAKIYKRKPTNFGTYVIDTTVISYGINTVTIDPSDGSPVVYTLNASGFAATSIQIYNNDTVLGAYYYNSSGQLDSARLIFDFGGNSDTLLIKHTFNSSGRISIRELLINGIIQNSSTETYEYEASSPTIRYNPYFDGYPGLTIFGKSLSDKYPSKVNGEPTGVYITTNSAGYIKTINGEKYIYSNCP